MVKIVTFVYYRFLMSTVVTSILWAQEVQITLPMPFLTSDFVYPYLVITTLPQLYGGKFKVDEIFSVIERHSITASLSLSDFKMWVSCHWINYHGCVNCSNVYFKTKLFAIHQIWFVQLIFCCQIAWSIFLFFNVLTMCGKSLPCMSTYYLDLE